METGWPPTLALCGLFLQAERAELVGVERGRGRARVVRADLVHVGGDVTREVDQRTDADSLARVVEVARRARAVGAQCDAVEAGLPVVCAAARAFGWAHECEVVSRAQLFDHLGGDVDGVAAIDRDRAKTAEQDAERAAQPLALDTPGHVEA